MKVEFQLIMYVDMFASDKDRQPINLLHLHIIYRKALVKENINIQAKWLIKQPFIFIGK